MCQRDLAHVGLFVDGKLLRSLAALLGDSTFHPIQRPVTAALVKLGGITNDQGVGLYYREGGRTIFS
ncbi:MAG TPA: hypothetical protein PK708_11245 [Candidatus Competibacter sp.]|nr:hypothetical protein [Candidatus Competibacter sp.]